MNAYCVIGARGGSKGIPDKNIQVINGQSLLSLAVDKAIRCNIFDRVFVSSDKEAYQNELPEDSGAEFILRPPEISGDRAIEQDYLSHVIEEKKLSQDGIIARMQCTSPFQSLASMVNAVQLLAKHVDIYDSVQLVTPASPSIYKALVLDARDECLRPALPGGSLGPTNRQGLPAAYFRSNFYVTRIENIIKGGLMGEKSHGLVVGPKEKIDIDNPLDLELARLIAEKHPEWLY